MPSVEMFISLRIQSLRVQKSLYLQLQTLGQKTKQNRHGIFSKKSNLEEKPQSSYARCMHSRKTTHSLDGLRQYMDRTESIRMTEDKDKWRKYVHDVANPQIKDG